MPLSAVDSVSPAIEHAKAQLFRPFRLGQWSRLALVGLFAGELSSGGGCNGGNFQIPSHTGGGGRHDYLLSTFPDPWIFAPLIIGLLIALPFLWLLFMYLNSRLRFVLFDSVIAKRCEIRRMWAQRGEPALRYFLWQIVFGLISLAGMAIIIGVPALFALALGWFSAPRDHLVGWILAGMVVFFVLMAWVGVVAVVHVFTKDFVVPQMALEGVSAFEGWSRLWKMVQSEKGGYAGYAGMKLLFAIGAAFIFGILTCVVVVCGVADFSACHCVFSSVFDLLFCRTVSAARGFDRSTASSSGFTATGDSSNCTDSGIRDVICSRGSDTLVRPF